MGCIETRGITPYYIDLDLPKNAGMKAKTKAYNLNYMLTQMTVHERINMKSWYPLLYDGGLLLKLHLVNDTFMTAPSLASTDSGIFACSDRNPVKTTTDKQDYEDLMHFIEVNKEALENFAKMKGTDNGK